MHTNKKRLEGGSLFNRMKNLTSDVKDKLQTNVTDKVTKQTQAIIKKSGVTGEATPENLRKYCKLVEALISAAKYDPSGQAITKIRNQILDDLPKDVYEYFSGEQKFNHLDRIPTKEEVVNFYWGELLFRQIWEKLGLTKEMLEVMADEDAVKALKQLDK